MLYNHRGSRGTKKINFEACSDESLNTSTGLPLALRCETEPGRVRELTRVETLAFLATKRAEAGTIRLAIQRLLGK